MSGYGNGNSGRERKNLTSGLPVTAAGSRCLNKELSCFLSCFILFLLGWNKTAWKLTGRPYLTNSRATVMCVLICSYLWFIACSRGPFTWELTQQMSEGPWRESRPQRSHWSSPSANTQMFSVGTNKHPVIVALILETWDQTFASH